MLLKLKTICFSVLIYNNNIITSPAIVTTFFILLGMLFSKAIVKCFVNYVSNVSTAKVILFNIIKIVRLNQLINLFGVVEMLVQLYQPICLVR